MPRYAEVEAAGEDSREADKFPTRLAFSVWIVQLYNGIQYSEIFTLAVYAVRGFEGEGATEKRIGQLAGLLAATSSFAVGVAAWPWGLASDRIGRKPVVLLGNCATAACLLIFGTARAYWVALVSRLIAGLLDGSLVMTKVMVGERCTPSMQAQVMSYLALGDAMGNILGPTLGGLLSNPCGRFTSVQGTAFCSPESPFAQFPYLLPCALTASLGVIVSVINVLTMDETLPRGRAHPYRRLRDTPSLELVSEPSKPTNKLASTEADAEAVAEILGSIDGDPDMPADGCLGARAKAAKLEPSDEELAISDKERLGIPAGERLAGRPEPLHSDTSPRPESPSRAHEGLDVRWDHESPSLLEYPSRSAVDSMRRRSDGNAGEDAALITRSTADVEAGALHKPGAAETVWWRSRPLIMSLLVAAWMLSIAKYNDELGPVFVSAPVKQGGLGMPLEAFALPLSVGGVVLTLFALFGYPRLQRAVGLKTTCSVGLLAAIPGDLIMPTAAVLRAYPWLEKATIFVAIAITKLTTQTAFTASMVIINSLAPREHLGSVNGVRMMLAALGRSSGPVLGGTLWGISASLTFPGHHYLAFLVASAALVGCWALHHRTQIHIPP